MQRKPEPSFEVKVTIWDIAAKETPHNLSSIQRQLDAKLERMREKAKISEDTPDVRTIKRIIEKDINKLEPEVVISRLPRDIWHLRSDYEILKQFTEKMREWNAVITKARYEHFTHLADVASWILANDLDDVWPNPLLEIGEPFDKYKYLVGSSEDGHGIANDSELADRLEESFNFAYDYYGSFDIDCLESHLKAEIPEVRSKGLHSLISDNPYKLIENLKILSRKKIFEGTCPICEDW